MLTVFAVTLMAMVGAAVSAKGTAAVMAITDGTAAAGLPVGGTAA